MGPASFTFYLNQDYYLCSDIEVACYTYEGVDAVKSALRGGLALSTEDMPIKINLIAPPLYVVTTQTLERTEGLALLNTAVQRIQELIEEAGGVFDMKQPPKVVSDLEEADLEVGGDSDADSFGDASGGEEDEKDS